LEVPALKESVNIETVKAMYAAFSRGDIAGILTHMDESIVFTVPGTSAVPVAGVRNGLPEVQRFFEDLERRHEFSLFEPRDFIAQANRVVALVHYEGRDKATGRAFAADAAMLWTFGDGRAIRFQEFTDTEALANAARGSTRITGAA
jgi:ketosteroid isomerase-like protein